MIEDSAAPACWYNFYFYSCLHCYCDYHALFQQKLAAVSSSIIIAYIKAWLHPFYFFIAIKSANHEKHNDSLQTFVRAIDVEL
jgi:hypothetical protein